MFKRFLAHSALYGLAPQLTKVISIFTLPILTAYLTPLDYAISGLVSVYLGLFAALQTLGLNIIVGNTFYKYNRNDHYKIIWRQVLGFLQLYSLLYGIVVSIVLYLLLPSEVSDNRVVIVALNVLPTVFFSPTQFFVFRYYQKKEIPLPLTIRSVILSFITIGLNLYFIAYLELGYMGWFYAGAISSTLSFSFFFYPFYFKYKFTPIFNFKWKTIKKFLKISLPTIPHYYSSYLLKSSDRAVMDFQKVSTTNIGLYSFANNFSNYFEALTTAFASSSGPMYLKSYRFKAPVEADLYARKLTYMMLIILCSGTFFFSIWSKEIFDILVNNDELKLVYPMSIILVMSYTYKPMYFAAFTKIAYHEKTKSLWKISFFAGAFNVISNILLIPFFGYEIAIYTTFISMMYMGYSGFFLKEFKTNNTVNFYPIPILILMVIITASAYYIVELNIYIKSIISLFLVLVGLLVLFKKNKMLEQKII